MVAQGELVAAPAVPAGNPKPGLPATGPPPDPQAEAVRARWRAAVLAEPEPLAAVLGVQADALVSFAAQLRAMISESTSRGAPVSEVLAMCDLAIRLEKQLATYLRLFQETRTAIPSAASEISSS